MPEANSGAGPEGTRQEAAHISKLILLHAQEKQNGFPPAGMMALESVDAVDPVSNQARLTSSPP
jgi:hypothetical protein